MVTVQPIHSEADYDAALEEIGTIMDALPGTPDGDRLEVLTVLVAAWEAEHYPIPEPDPIAMILHVMEAKELTRADLVPLIGNKGRVSEVLNRKRPLTLDMIRRLHEGLGIPADVLVQAYPLAAE